MCVLVQLLELPQIGALFPADVIERARVFLSDIPGGVGAYSDSAGALVLRKQIAAAIERRDGHPASPDEIYLTVRGRRGSSSRLAIWANTGCVWYKLVQVDAAVGCGCQALMDCSCLVMWVLGALSSSRTCRASASSANLKPYPKSSSDPCDWSEHRCAVLVYPATLLLCLLVCRTVRHPRCTT
jgi:hypothetical protein